MESKKTTIDLVIFTLPLLLNNMVQSTGIQKIFLIRLRTVTETQVMIKGCPIVVALVSYSKLSAVCYPAASITTRPQQLPGQKCSCFNKSSGVLT